MRIAAGIPSAVSALLLAVAWLATPRLAGGQSPPGYGWHSDQILSGAIGSEQPDHGRLLPGNFQLVQIQAPRGVLIWPASEGTLRPLTAPLTAGLLVGYAYRFGITGIPNNEGFEVFPTIELIDRLDPPSGQEARFPIPVQLTLEELEMALAGKLVTRVIYLEDPETPLPRAEDPSEQRYFEASPGEDPFELASQLGRPMAILRMGSRLPDQSASGDAFLGGQPPLQLITSPQAVPLPTAQSRRSGVFPATAPRALPGNFPSRG
jgi:hypothetical protein